MDMLIAMQMSILGSKSGSDGMSNSNSTQQKHNQNRGKATLNNHDIDK